MSDFTETAARADDADPSEASAWPWAGEGPGDDGEAAPSEAQRESARAARLARFKREQLIVDYLNRGVSVVEIAARIGVGEKRMRAIIREILARRQPAPPQEFVAIQVNRLNEALLVAFSAMTDLNLKAVDRVVRIVRELDRYHGLADAGRRRPAPERIDALAEGAGKLDPAFIYRKKFSYQDDDETRVTMPDYARRDPRHDLHPLALRSDAEGGASRRAFPEPVEGALADRVLCPSFETPPPAAPQAEGMRGCSRDSRPQNPPQAVEKIDSAPELATPFDPNPLVLRSDAKGGASRRRRPPRTRPAPGSGACG
jgi:hypothetical protein